MKKRLFICFILNCIIMQFSLFADSGKTLKFTIEGRRVEYPIDAIASIKYSGDAMLVKCKNGVTNEWNLSLVNKMIIDKGMVNTTSLSQNISSDIYIEESGLLSFSFENPTPVRIYSLSGRIVCDEMCVGVGALDLKSYGCDVFIVNAGGRIFKISNR